MRRAYCQALRVPSQHPAFARPILNNWAPAANLQQRLPVLRGQLHRARQRPARGQVHSEAVQSDKDAAHHAARAARTAAAGCCCRLSRASPCALRRASREPRRRRQRRHSLLQSVEAICAGFQRLWGARRGRVGWVRGKSGRRAHRPHSRLQSTSMSPRRARLLRRDLTRPAALGGLPPQHTTLIMSASSTEGWNVNGLGRAADLGAAPPACCCCCCSTPPCSTPSMSVAAASMDRFCKRHGRAARWQRRPLGPLEATCAGRSCAGRL
jgi:hypothetical protein